MPINLEIESFKPLNISKPNYMRDDIETHKDLIKGLEKMTSPIPISQNWKLAITVCLLTKGLEHADHHQVSRQWIITSHIDGPGRTSARLSHYKTTISQ